MKRLVIVAALALAGCASKAPPEPIIRTVEIKVPVRTPCTPAPVPAPTYTADTVDLASNIFELVRALLVDREERKATETKLRGAIASCG
jgi:uncharacterized lipoprotein YmbA